MICEICRKPARLSAYSVYTPMLTACSCPSAPTPMSVTGHPYPPIAYSRIAPPLSVQAAYSRAATATALASSVSPQADAYNASLLVPPVIPPGTPEPATASTYSVYRVMLSTLPVATPPLTPARVAEPVPAVPPASFYSAYRPMGTTAPVVAPAWRAAGRSMDPGHRTESTPGAIDGVVAYHLRLARDRPDRMPGAEVRANVRYLHTEPERAPYRVEVNGRLTQRGRAMSTTGARKVMRLAMNSTLGPMGEITNRFIYVMSIDGVIYAADASGEYKAGGVFDQGEFKVRVNNTADLAARFGGSIHGKRTLLSGFHHSSFLAGEDVACAGEIEVSEGKLVSINNNSGHYTPPPVCLLAVVDRLRLGGINPESFEIGINVSNGMVHGQIRYFRGLARFAAYLRTQPG